MTIKSTLKEMALYSITPIPQKYHFVGVDNKRAARNFTIAVVALNVAVSGVLIAAPVIVTKMHDLNDRVKNRLKKD